MISFRYMDSIDYYLYMIWLNRWYDGRECTFRDIEYFKTRLKEEVNRNV